MADTIAELTALVDGEDGGRHSWSELEPPWIDAIDRRFQECRGRIPILAQLAERAGIDAVGSLDDVVPLLFAHTA